MITTEAQGLAELVASLVKLKVAISAIELLMLDDIGLSIAQVTEQVVIKEEASFIDAISPLALTAHADNWLEFV